MILDEMIATYEECKESDSVQKELIKARLIEEWKGLARSMSYYNAAEGDMWRKEAADRQICRESLMKVTEALGEEVVAQLRKEGSYLL